MLFSWELTFCMTTKSKRDLDGAHNPGDEELPWKLSLAIGIPLARRFPVQLIIIALGRPIRRLGHKGFWLHFRDLPKLSFGRPEIS